jgi:hypothetical protein
MVLGVAFALGGSAAMASFGPERVLRTAPEGTVVRVGGMDSSLFGLAVAWDERGGGSARAYLRLRPQGEAFGPSVALRGGRPARDPRVAACPDFLFAVSTWPRPGGGTKVGLDVRPQGSAADLFSPGHRALGRGSRPDVACDGSRMAAAWFGEGGRVRFHVQFFTDADSCPDGCRFAVAGDLGPGSPKDGLSISTWRRGFIVAWKQGARLLVRRLVVGFNHTVGLVVKPQAPLTVLNTAAARFPLLAGERGTVALAYHWRGEVRVRVSDDAGRSFGPARVLRKAPCANCGIVPRPLSLDLDGDRVLVEALTGIGSPPVRGTIGFVSTDVGRTWSVTSRHRNAAKVGALSGSRVAEAWDGRYLNGRSLRFHAGPLP